MESTIYNQAGKSVGKMKLPEASFGVKWSDDVVHEVVRLMNSNSRDPIAHTKTRGEVSGTGKKPWKQKGTGRARHGSTRSPIWVGGGIAHGPRNDKNYERKINKKAKDKAFKMILSRKAAQGEVLLVDDIKLNEAKTKNAKSVIVSLSGIKGYEKLATKKQNTAIFAFPERNESSIRSFRNIGNVKVEEFRNLNPVSLLNNTYLIVVNPEASFKFIK